MFSISMRAEDDRSQVNMFLDVGTVPGGTDVLEQFALGGPKTEVDEVNIFNTNPNFNIYVFINTVQLNLPKPNPE